MAVGGARIDGQDRAKTRKRQWQGTATELLAELILLVGEKVTRIEDLAEQWAGAVRPLRRAASFLRRVGIDVAFAQEGHAKTRLITITAYSPAPGPAVERKFASASSALEVTPNDVNNLGSKPLRTQTVAGADANDAAADANDAGGPGVCVRSNPLTS